MTSHATVNPMDLSGRRYLVTGASAGIGRATAQRLAQLGAEVILNGRDEEALEATRSALVHSGHVVAPFELSRVDELAKWVSGLAAEHGRLSGFVHCAGMQVTKPIRIFDQAHFDQTMHVNLASAIAICRGLRSKRCRADKAAVVFVSSVAGLIGQPGNVVYGASKAGLMSLTRGLAMELLRDGIRVNCVAPALVETEMAQKTRESMTDAQYQNMLDRHPMGVGEPMNVADAITFC